jgi:hypothetical protein
MRGVGSTVLNFFSQRKDIFSHPSVSGLGADRRHGLARIGESVEVPFRAARRRRL